MEKQIFKLQGPTAITLELVSFPSPADQSPRRITYLHWVTIRKTRRIYGHFGTVPKPWSHPSGRNNLIRAEMENSLEYKDIKAKPQAGPHTTVVHCNVLPPVATLPFGSLVSHVLRA